MAESQHLYPHKSIYIGQPESERYELWMRCTRLAQARRRTLSSVIMELLSNWEQEQKGPK